MGFFGFGKKVAAAKVELKKVENRDLMEAIIGGCLLVAAADGEIEKEETDKLDQLLRSNPQLSHFGNEITQVIGRFTEQLQAGFRVGRLNILRELDDVKNTAKDAEEVFVNMLTIAEADGEIEPAEQKVLEEVGRRLGLRIEDYL
ncbi:tellurite resistance TerB family protein [Dickeya dianthicola]|uniref:Tellurite resistance protein n=1 Tax=Dickeya dianthicola TaxID=204039 RepID=A0AAX1C586_9GAMM|nr:TerB family tellurite resistance protein [Dickeya dianthicola]ATO31557.1 Tellurite resistance protein TerB [Dickeya dianthicola RNS04.9]MCA7005028.1 TerB family tellurite resistance protein [Dickeya dianthicola]MCI4005077.1 TerB family tellurite resistance protein [Dickeya dianthicola]MCI4033131.1 TerB family tellurite resistance protein [Dickeya dianthicola]MCI4153979.1 TerB family tellurite resistance protein [Dickeya dianthicola]